ncbi:hypothetical protein, partial [Actinomyces timonensis]|uniref:hypothetical protein n=1 Tax=Actinomyces timonensis TaxID=1288391 RepID=UPI0005B76EB6
QRAQHERRLRPQRHKRSRRQRRQRPWRADRLPRRALDASLDRYPWPGQRQQREQHPPHEQRYQR